MNSYITLVISIGVLAFVDTYMTATILPIPVWVTFIAWASFFACGGGKAGWVRSVISNWVGILIAATSLYGIGLMGGSPMAAGICVGIGSAGMIVVTKIKLIAFPPAIVFGFASFVGTTVATGHDVTTAGIHNPILVASLSMLVGACFGFVSEIFANAMTARKPVTA
ncbi:MAG: DUF1097 domain-containing protein [Rhodospirillales bacterium]|nr:DUF1097 domain-containing protein [Rhodospirillales bacterium]